MATTIIKFKDWMFEVDRESTFQTYRNVQFSGSDGCECPDCKNYQAYRDRVFPTEIIDLFDQLGIDYRKEVEVLSYEVLPTGLHHVGGWLHFQGQILSGKICRVQLPFGGYTLDLTPMTDNFSIGFSEEGSLTFFEKDVALVQVEFETNIPWVINKSLEIL